MNRRLAAGILGLGLLFSGISALADYEWANDAVAYCKSAGIIQGVGGGDLALEGNLTREQMAKMLVLTFNVQKDEESSIVFSDVSQSRWSYPYIDVFKKFMVEQNELFKPEQYVTREEFASYLVLASGLSEKNIRNREIIDVNFDDYQYVSKQYKTLLSIAVERGYIKGADGLLRPKDLLNRAEVCTLLYRVILSNQGKLTLDLGVRASQTSMIGSAQVSLEQAKKWAQNRGAHERFIEIADIYWKYGEITGIRPEILYAQAAKETNFGKYTGAVLPEQNNWAGIKTATATGDRTEDHETFATPDDGVRAHFNHMSAYIGLAPIGEPHARYYSVVKLKWAGTVKNLEELGGKWAPDLYYGYSILHNYLEPMMATQI
ncbi:MAG: S-layer homology domain-containing protein [Clostridia bacterium]|nr:S-layer homology domain-containing protein [Clostridia bacterium]